MQAYVEAVNERISHLVSADKDSDLSAAMHYSLINGGKRIRPALFLSIVDAFREDWEAFIDMAVALEMVHTYSLIHDDLPAMDDDVMRRGKPTLHVAFSESTAILSGDALLTDAFSLIANIDTMNTSRRLCAIKILSEGAGSKGMVKGQMLDLKYENTDTSVKTLNHIHAHKTGRLIAAAMMMGACAAGEDPTAFESIGIELGLAFQIQDDILEATTDETTMGKSFSDAKHNKSTYVSYSGIDGAKQALSHRFQSIREALKNLPIDVTKIEPLIQAIETRTH